MLILGIFIDNAIDFVKKKKKIKFCHCGLSLLESRVTNIDFERGGGIFRRISEYFEGSLGGGGIDTRDTI